MLVQIDYKLTFDAPFHLGTGITAGQIDRTVIRSADNLLYVPASTFKGVLREHCEQLYRFYQPEAQVASPHNALAALTEYGNPPTLISRIFGSRLYPGGLRFNDAALDEDALKDFKENQEMQTSVATQVRIDRLTRTAADEALYTSEFGIRALAFQGRIKGPLHCTAIQSLASAEQGDDTPTPTYSLLLLLASLLLLERLGGNKSTGKGQCNCVITEIKLDKQPCYEEQWNSWLEHLDVLREYPGGKA